MIVTRMGKNLKLTDVKVNDKKVKITTPIREYFETEHRLLKEVNVAVEILKERVLMPELKRQKVVK